MMKVTASLRNSIRCARMPSVAYNLSSALSSPLDALSARMLPSP